MLFGWLVVLIKFSLLSILSILSITFLRTFSVVSIGASLEAIWSLAYPICDSSCMIRLFLMSLLSFRVFSSTSCWAMVLLQEFTAVLRNSTSGLETVILDDLCLDDVVGNLGWVLCSIVGS